MPDGTTIEGNDAVKAYFERELELVKQHGTRIIFQIYRVNLGARTIAELQGRRLAELRVEGSVVSGSDTVADVKRQLRSLLAGEPLLGCDLEATPEFRFREAEQMSCAFDGRWMSDDLLFYADHFVVLPAWVQVILHECNSDELMSVARKLGDPRAQ